MGSVTVLPGLDSINFFVPDQNVTMTAVELLIARGESFALGAYKKP
ncbi:MAG: hypothetical protein K6T66_00465 [Peptococcaceae bacterium]|nr:hypothetical protein [Peptococcaceae bacterium]